MKRLVIAGVALAAVAAGLAVWLLTRSDGEPSGYPTPKAALVAVCHADPSKRFVSVPPIFIHSPPGATPSVEPKMTMQLVPWTPRGAAPGHGWVAIVNQSGAGRWKVIECKQGQSVAGFSEVPAPSPSH